MTWRVDHTTPGFQRPGSECARCGGEGYFYVSRDSRHATHPVQEIKCRACGGTGVKP